MVQSWGYGQPSLLAEKGAAGRPPVVSCSHMNREQRSWLGKTGAGHLGMSTLQGLRAWSSGLSWVVVPWGVCTSVPRAPRERQVPGVCVLSRSWPASACRLGIPRTCLSLGSLERGHGPIASNGLGRVQTAGSCHQEGDRTSGWAFRVLGWGPRAEGVGGSAPGGAVVFLEHLGIRRCCTVKAPVTEAEAPAPAHS